MINRTSPIYVKNTSNIALLSNNYFAKNVSFKGAPDSFETGFHSEFGLLSEDKIREIMKSVDEKRKIGQGYKANIFRHEDLIIKYPKEQQVDARWRDYFLGQNLKEFLALRTIEKINPDITPKAHDIVRHKDAFCIIEDFVEGVHSGNGKKISIDNIHDLLPKFAQLDKHGIVSCDLSDCNIFLLDNGKTKLIDFGSYKFLDDFGKILDSDAFPSEFFKKDGEIFNFVKKSSKHRFTRSFFQSPLSIIEELPGFFPDVKNFSDNPYLNVASNASNFELRTFYGYIKENSKNENLLDFFREYVRTKGNSYHATMEEFLRTLNIDDVVTSTDTPEQIEKAKSMLKKSIGYESAAKQLLSNPNDKTLKTELAKIQLKAFLDSYDYGSPIPNSKKIRSAYNQLISILEQNIGASDGIEKEYYSETLSLMRKRFEKYPFQPEQVDIPNDENLIKCIFKEETQRNVTNNLLNIIRNNRVPLMIISAVGVIGIGATFLYKKHKNLSIKKAEEIAKNVAQKEIETQIFNNNKSNIFSSFG